MSRRFSSGQLFNFGDLLLLIKGRILIIDYQDKINNEALSISDQNLIPMIEYYFY